LDSTLRATIGGFQIFAVVLLLVTAIYRESSRKTRVPLLLRPGLVISLAMVVASIAVVSLTDEDFGSYATLWFSQIIGIFLGLLLSRALLYRPSAERIQVVINQPLMARSADAIFAFGALLALAFFAWRGVPALQGNVEQGRVDAAIEGTGYLRLAAYLTIPSSLMLFALGRKHAWAFVGASFLIIIALANRSPLPYLFVPLLFVYIYRTAKPIGSLRVIIYALVLGSAIVAFGTFRILGQADFENYQEYRQDIRDGNVLGVALTSFTHYAEVVADNAVLAKSLVDSGAMSVKYGTSYLILFITALPGEQLSLDREIKLLSGKTFIGGGTPPTLMGEGYVNFGYLGTILSGFFVTFLLEYWFRELLLTSRHSAPAAVTVAFVTYGYMVYWVIGSQVAGLIGASTFPMACAIVFLILWHSTTKRLPV